jgi:amino-acid N-acetyltransferase
MPIERAAAADLAAIRGLLEAAGLPTADLEGSQPEFIVLREAGRLIAAGALQRFGSTALLRSVVVEAADRRRGFGERIVRALEQLARQGQIAELVLLTQTAAGFFARQGYRAIERSAAPAATQASAEFRTLCPGSAICMRKQLAASGEASP